MTFRSNPPVKSCRECGAEVRSWASGPLCDACASEAREREPSLRELQRANQERLREGRQSVSTDVKGDDPATGAASAYRGTNWPDNDDHDRIFYPQHFTEDTRRGWQNR